VSGREGAARGGGRRGTRSGVSHKHLRVSPARALGVAASGGGFRDHRHEFEDKDSGAEKLPDPSSTKGAISALTKTLAMDLIERGVRVDAVQRLGCRHVAAQNGEARNQSPNSFSPEQGRPYRRSRVAGGEDAVAP
jgi:NAD(P)-dependent dehydrogenase (short-subunit alcohol dehydrogenase family)